MLADRGDSAVSTGKLGDSVHLPGAWRISLICYIWGELPKWRDDPGRPNASGETVLTSQLCAHLNSAVRKSQGWDFLQFRVEEADETVKSRKIDLIPAPSGTVIWIDGREYSQYSTLLPIECKRLPTPVGQKRDNREYLFSAHSSTGGVQRYKAGHNGAAHSVAAMIAYIQGQNIEYWIDEVQRWLNEIVENRVPNWEESDALLAKFRSEEAQTAVLQSEHCRNGDLSPIRLYHLWVVMGASVLCTAASP